jgi:hypothetical protein
MFRGECPQKRREIEKSVKFSFQIILSFQSLEFLDEKQGVKISGHFPSELPQDSPTKNK